MWFFILFLVVLPQYFCISCRNDADCGWVQRVGTESFVSMSGECENGECSCFEGFGCPRCNTKESYTCTNSLGNPILCTERNMNGNKVDMCEFAAGEFVVSIKRIEFCVQIFSLCFSFWILS
eukprot:TRINITY_DN60128_c0_g1_i1.p1 TRINITY_DN60128_c0_g1~~TRINITY_DN60128_c0_g1_i1.p1  ORF type:complete len:122 (-),score=3.58 TRINITY_DN60128_c0_g1_i1:334-699(-)